jgi:hypothetical protein
MGKGLGIAAFVILLLSLPIPVYRNYISLLAVIILAVAALTGEKMWVVITDLIAWVKMFLLSPSWHLMMSSSGYMKSAANAVNSLGTSDAVTSGMVNQGISTATSVNHSTLMVTVAILSAPIAILVIKVATVRKSGAAGVALEAFNFPPPSTHSEAAFSSPAPGAAAMADTPGEADQGVTIPARRTTAEPSPAPINKVLIVALFAMAAALAWLLYSKNQPAQQQVSAPPPPPPIQVRPIEKFVADTPPAAAPAPEAVYRDMTSYCAAVRTVDEPDQRYVGPRYPAELAAAIHLAVKDLQDGSLVARWRCQEGKVLGCRGDLVI